MSKFFRRKAATLAEGAPQWQEPKEKYSSRHSEELNLSECLLDGDVWIYRIIVGGLASAVLLAIMGAIVLQVNGKETPQLLTGLGTGALSGLTALLAPAPTRKTRESS